MVKEQKCAEPDYKLTDEQRLSRICSILSIGIMRRIQAEKSAGTTIYTQAGQGRSDMVPQKNKPKK